MKNISEYLNLAIVIIMCIISGLLIGYWLDKVFNFVAIFKILGIFIGVILAFMYLFHVSKDAK